MKKQMLLLLMLPIIYNCTSQAVFLPQTLKAKVQFNNFPVAADKINITITEPDCKNINLCGPISFNIGAGGSMLNFAEVTPGNKIVNIKIYKDGMLVSETNRNITVVLNQDNSISIPEVNSTANPAPSITPTPAVSIEPTPIATVTATSTPVSTPIPTATPSPTATPRSGGGGGGGGTTVITTPTPPTIQASATINPDNTGVR